MQEIIKASTDVTLAIRLHNATTGAPETGLTIGNLQIRYIRVEDDNDVTISAWQSLTALGSLTDPHTDNRGFEISEGYYRIDFPDAAFATAAGQVTVLVQDSVGSLILVQSREIMLVTSVQDSCNAAIVANNLDHLCVSAVGTLSDVLAETSLLSQIMSKSGIDDYNRATDSQEGIKEAIDLLFARLGSPISIDGSGSSLVAMLIKMIDDNGGADFDATTDSQTQMASKQNSVKLASDGLDSVATTEPAGVASNFREMMVQTWRRFFKKTTASSSQLKTYKDDTSVGTTQTVSFDGSTKEVGDAS